MYNNNNFVIQLRYAEFVIVEFIFKTDYYRQKSRLFHGPSLDIGLLTKLAKFRNHSRIDFNFNSKFSLDRCSDSITFNFRIRTDEDWRVFCVSRGLWMDIGVLAKRC